MSCCAHCRAVEDQFGPGVARRDLERYRKKGPDRITRLLLEAVGGLDLRKATLLDVGAGVGVILHELLDRDIDRATCVEAAPAYLAEARAESERRGHDNRVRFVQGDLVELADDIEPADVVTLNRVVCCYPDYVALVSRSADKAGSYYVLSVPRDRWHVRAGVALHNVVRRLTGNAFRAFVHPTSALDRLLRDAGFTRRWHRSTVVWEVSLFARDQ